MQPLSHAIFGPPETREDGRPRVPGATIPNLAGDSGSQPTGRMRSENHRPCGVDSPDRIFT